MAIRTEHVGGLESVPAEAWDALVGEGCPFLEHAFLRGLEVAGCVGPNTGWAPAHVLAWRGRDLVGALPLYRKEHSYGEFIFDWAWADASMRAGAPYYPKLLSAAPFSPVGGPRLLVAPDEGDATRRALLHHARSMARAAGDSGLHLLFVTQGEAALLESEGLCVRHTHQFHWINEGYPDLDAFLARFRSKRRNQIRRERRAVRESGVTLRVLEDEALTPDLVPLAWVLYTSTVDKYFQGNRYLSRGFFEWLFVFYRHRLQLVLAERDGRVLGGAINVRKGDALYGRYWGDLSGEPFLHFEICAYAGIELAITRGLSRFEAGAGGGAHKFGRGFSPVVTYSAHELAFKPLDRAVRAAVAHEREVLARELERARDAVFAHR